jgi:hypothetical protein
VGDGVKPQNDPELNAISIPVARVQVAPVAAAPTRTEILEQLDRILKSPAFSKSQRYSAFLQYCVETALGGHSEFLKERTIGIEVFERKTNYEPGIDHVVRSAASEVRRRLAQYYQGCADSGAVRIELLPGSYTPQFSLSHPPGPALVEAPSAVTPEQAPARRTPSWRRKGVAAAIVTALALLIVSLYRPWRAPTAFERFWGPLLSSPRQIPIFVGPSVPDSTVTGSVPQDDSSITAATFMRNNVVSFASAATLAKLTGFLQAKGRSSQVLLSTASKFDDLQHGPAVLLGGLNNTWTLRLTDTLRFGFDIHARAARIHDRQRPEEGWSFDFTMPYRKVTRDYALVSRVLHPAATEQMTLIVAGLGQWGTVAAADFIMDPVRLQKLTESAPNRWWNMNLQVVVAVEVVDGAIGPPKAVATYFW